MGCLCKHCGESDSTNFYKGRRTCCKRCQSARTNERYHALSEEDKQAYKKRATDWQSNNMFRYRLLTAKARADKKNLEFAITESDIQALWDKQDGLCYYSQLPMDMSVSDVGHSGSSLSYSVSIDRLDSAKGYIMDNVVLCCSVVNTMKNEMAYDDFMRLVKAICNNSA